MTRPPYNVLFLCTGNSARSILAEALLNHLPGCRGKFVGYSAGSQPKGAPHAQAIALLRHSGIPTEGLHSKSWDVFAEPDAPRLDFIFTVCDQAAGEACPYWPGTPVTAHWGMPDPAAVTGTPETIRKAFSDTLMTLRHRLAVFSSLPFERLDRLALQQQLGEIGRG